MRMRKEQLIILACVCLAAVGLLVWSMAREALHSPTAPIVEVTGFETITLEIHGMRGSTVYEIIPEGNEVEISFYEIRVRDGADVKELAMRASCDRETMLTLLNQCGFTGWNGFYGKHPKNVKDGEMFELAAIVNDGLEIRAEGSANFPRHFSEFRSTIDRILRE